jgi:GNAT superfamily N-acetyltransferase
LNQLSPVNPEVVNQIQENLIAYFRIYAGLPGTTFVENAQVTWNAGPPGSMVFRARLSPERVEEQIDEIIRQIGQSTTVIDWFVFPSCQPAELGERVAARGLAGGPDGAWTLIGKIGGPGGNWMLADLTALPPAPLVAEPFHVVQVENTQMLETWRQCSAAGFGGGDYQDFYAAYARHGFASDAFSLHYIGYLGDQPVTSSTLLLAGDIPGLFDISTPPALRRQGFGSAISWAMLQEAKKRGYGQVYVWSSDLGKNVYRGVGFVPVALGMREYEWKKR